MATPGMSNTCEKYPTTAKSTEFVVQVSDATIMDGRSKSRAHSGMTTARAVAAMTLAVEMACPCLKRAGMCAVAVTFCPSRNP